MGIKLHLGCGKRRIPGFVNVDIDPRNEPDVVADCFDERFSLDYFSRTFDWQGPQADIIYACHVLEHCGRHEYKAVLRQWHGLLKPGGTLRLAVPDLGVVMARYGDNEDGNQNLDEILGLLYGGQRNEHDYHKMGWDFFTLKRDLGAAGFVNVREYDRDKTEHADVDDYSASYLPHIRDCKSMEEYRKGTLISLDVEATKP